MLWLGLVLRPSSLSATMSGAEKQWGRFKFDFDKCVLITYHVAYNVLGIVRDTVVNSFTLSLRKSQATKEGSYIFREL